MVSKKKQLIGNSNTFKIKNMRLNCYISYLPICEFSVMYTRTLHRFQPH